MDTHSSKTQNVLASALAVGPAEAARLAGVGRTTLYLALGTGDLKSFKFGRRRMIRIEALQQWLEELEKAASAA